MARVKPKNINRLTEQELEMYHDGNLDLGEDLPWEEDSKEEDIVEEIDVIDYNNPLNKIWIGGNISKFLGIYFVNGRRFVFFCKMSSCLVNIF